MGLYLNICVCLQIQTVSTNVTGMNEVQLITIMADEVQNQVVTVTTTAVDFNEEQTIKISGTDVNEVQVFRSEVAAVQEIQVTTPSPSPIFLIP